MRTRGGRSEYLTSWRGYTDVTWEPPSHFVGEAAKSKLNEFKKRQKLAAAAGANGADGADGAAAAGGSGDSGASSERDEDDGDGDGEGADGRARRKEPKPKRALPRVEPLPSAASFIAVRTNHPVADRPLTYRPMLGDDERAISGSDAIALDHRRGPAHRPSPCSPYSVGSPVAEGGTTRDVQWPPSPSGFALGPSTSGAPHEAGAERDVLSHLFCRRCFSYGCALHGAGQPLPRAPAAADDGGAEIADFLQQDVPPHLWDAVAPARGRGRPPKLSTLAARAAAAEDAAAARGAGAGKRPCPRPTAGASEVGRSCGCRLEPAMKAAATEADAILVCMPALKPRTDAAPDDAPREAFMRGRAPLNGRPDAARSAAAAAAAAAVAVAEGATSQSQAAADGAAELPAAQPLAFGRKRAPMTALGLRQTLPKDEQRDCLVVACDHEGPCDTSNPHCVCIAGQNFCERFCSCGPSCKNRWPGCKCKKGDCSTNICHCFLARRECDPDVCHCAAEQFGTDDCAQCLPESGASHAAAAEAGGGASELPGSSSSSSGGAVVAGAPPEEAADARAECGNMSLQLGRQSRVLTGPSEVAGWGLFARDVILKGALIVEYVGELISQEEADRRGQVYDRRASSYLFNVNDKQVVDACPKGSQSRFANHSDKPNALTRVTLVRGDHRIGIFAKRRIQRGEEIFFDYRYDHEERQKYGFDGEADEGDDEDDDDDAPPPPSGRGPGPRGGWPRAGGKRPAAHAAPAEKPPKRGAP